MALTVLAVIECKIAADFFRSVQFSSLDMAQNGRPKNRAYSPYAVDSLEPTELSRDQSNFNGSQMNSAYSNLNLAQSQENISRNPVNTFKGSYQNPAYENAEVAHQYEDPSHLVGANPAPSTGPRRKRNLLYEPTDINRTDDEQVGKDDFGEEVGGDSWLSRLILFLILMISLTSLLLVVLIVVGKVGPSCNSCSEEKGEVPYRYLRNHFLLVGSLGIKSENAFPRFFYVTAAGFLYQSGRHIVSACHGLISKLIKFAIYIYKNIGLQ